MTEPDGREGADQESGGAEHRRAAPSPALRRKLAEVFGDVLPETTSDERDPRRGSGSSDDWYRENRPPHHDR
ncbi:hypothetical protein HQ32_00770 [Prauserella sp. Am3]|nr:hypothetical protein HQ32_00770 [Prauserella sp. Am3]